MADRYWVGGSNTWNATAGTKWALTSGGAGGQAVPTIADDVFLDGNSGSAATVVSMGSGSARTLNTIGYVGTLSFISTLTVGGNVTFDSTTKISGASTLTCNNNATIRYNNAQPNTSSTFLLALSNTTSTFTLADNITLTGLQYNSGNLNMQNITITTRGTSSWISTAPRTCNADGATIIIGNTASLKLPTSGLTMNAERMSITATGSMVTTTRNLEVGVSNFKFGNINIETAGSLYVKYTGSGGGGNNVVINRLNFNGAGGTLSVDRNTTVTLGKVTTARAGYGNMNVIRPVYNESPGSGVINASSGNINFSWVAMRSMVFSGGATFTAENSIDLGNNSGISITNPGTGPALSFPTTSAS